MSSPDTVSSALCMHKHRRHCALQALLQMHSLHLLKAGTLMLPCSLPA